MGDSFALTLKELSLKVTPKRLAILNILDEEPVYVSPEEIWEKMKERFARIGLPTVYRNLEELSMGGVITKVIHPNRQLYYYFCRNRRHHHHFICVSCRKVEDLDMCGIKGMEKSIEKTVRGKVLSHLVQINGLCNRCTEIKTGKGTI
ncbi:MAG: transcriptional repressor [Nitrospirae bacterium]|nr:transcriptional repressor [Nitrospirota bacterium]